MKPYKVTFYDGTGKKKLFVKADSANKAVAEAKEQLRQNKVIGATIVGAERVPARVFPLHGCVSPGDNWTNFVQAMDDYARSHVIRDPKHIECLIKGKVYTHGCK